jgi:hypothetical protein
MHDLIKKLFDGATWRVLGVSVCGFVSSGYAATKEALESVAAKTPSTGYDMAIARITALGVCVYILLKVGLLIRNRDKNGPN